MNTYKYIVIQVKDKIKKFNLLVVKNKMQIKDNGK